MKGDFTRDTFHHKNHFSRVLMQQGRVILDADFNEQTTILLYYMKTLARDLIGPYGRPRDTGGFKLSEDEHEHRNLKISQGRYYVDGILVENDKQSLLYTAQEDYPLPDDDPLLKEIMGRPTGKPFWVYLDVWERHITSIEDETIREAALGGPDSCTRAKVVRQVKAQTADEIISNLGTDEEKRAQLQKASEKIAQSLPDDNDGEMIKACEAAWSQLVTTSNSLLEARVDPGQKKEDPCVTPPESKYRGTENQLYRVEIHGSGQAGQATFKWSRDNGSIATRWLSTDGNDLHVANARGFAAGSWVELSGDKSDLLGDPGVLVKLAKVEGNTLSVDPLTKPQTGMSPSTENNDKVRRWDQVETGDIPLRRGAIPLTETSWIDLEDGIQVRFAENGEYRTSDYWLIPARVANGLEWPSSTQTEEQQFRHPRGVRHYYAPIGFVCWIANEDKWRIWNCKSEFKPPISG